MKLIETKYVNEVAVQQHVKTAYVVDAYDKLSGFSTLKILATVKPSRCLAHQLFCFSTLKILATVKQLINNNVETYVLVPLRF